MSEATVVSIAPFEVKEHKPGLIKGRFYIPAVPEGELTLLIVEDSAFHQNIPGSDAPALKVPVFARDIAKSIVDDIVTSHVNTIPGEAFPGLFWIDGRVTKEEVKTKYKAELEAVRVAQKNWFIELIKEADNDWNQFHNQKLINAHQRHALSALHLERDWNVQYDPAKELKECIACRTPIHPLAVKCPHCGYITDPVKAKQLGLV